MKKNLFALILLSTATITLFSCKKDNDVPANEITDSQGLNVKLNWSLTDGTDAIAGADIDYRIYKGVGAGRETTSLVSASSSDSFEDQDFSGTLDDGDYTLEIRYFEINKPGKFNIVFKAIGGDRSYSFSDNSFTTGDEAVSDDFIKITKAGTKYTVSKL